MRFLVFNKKNLRLSLYLKYLQFILIEFDINRALIEFSLI